MSMPPLRIGSGLPPQPPISPGREEDDNRGTKGDFYRRSSRPHLAIALNPLDNMAATSSHCSTPTLILSQSTSTAPLFPTSSCSSSSISQATVDTHKSSSSVPSIFTLSPSRICNSSDNHSTPDIPRTTFSFRDPSAEDMTVQKLEDPSKGTACGGSTVVVDIFTPPTTPASTATKKEIDTATPPPAFRLERSVTTHWDSSSSDSDMSVADSDDNLTLDKTSLLAPSEPYELDDPTHPTKLGSGAWSNVYKGTLRHSKLLIAVKRPLNAFSIPAVRREAAILSYIQRRVAASPPNQPPSIIPFHGFDDATNSILMTALSGENLEQFARSRATPQSYTASLTARRQPVVGIPQYLFICERLISAFTFFKSAGVIHGDVKPQNILMRPASTTSTSTSDWLADEERTSLLDPVVADFSSGYLVDEAGRISDDEEAISAVTTIYCAPELLAAFLQTPPTTPTKRDGETPYAGVSALTPLSSSPPQPPRPLPTFASDVYSLGMTLLQTALGSHPYAAARVEMQRNTWVRQGDPLAFARADERAMKVRVGGIVDRLLKGCFGKTAEGRVEIEDMARGIDEVVGEWRVRRTTGADGWV
ncbi:hypothetical protein TWF696_002089 [Orbilia brochopaga]|uniref:NEK6-subfamily protein kinase n=1 Tax=Orbilia brochopaga TaxID=3140254 RepID=A0AAV9U6Y6_9PEZI